MKAASLNEVYLTAKQYAEFSDFEHHLKHRFTGKPITQIIDDCDLVLVEKSMLQKLIDANKSK